MKNPLKKMVACDLSENSREAIRCAAELAKDQNTGMFIVNIVNQRDITAMETAIRKSVCK
jgi:hypothetical protein